VTVAVPVVKEIVEDDEFVGRFAAVADVQVRARVSGYLEAVHFTDGQLIEKDALLFTIDQRMFRTALTQAEAQLDVAKAQFDFAGEQFDRANQLLERGNIAQSTADERRQTYLSAQASLASATAAVEAAQIDIEFSEIRAPIAGRIGRVLTTEGNLVEANQSVLTSIVAPDPAYFYFDIDERYFLAYARDARTRGASLQEGGGRLPVRVTLSDGSVFGGVLDFSENRLDETTGTMRVRAILPNPDGVLQPGLFGRVNVPGSLPYRGVLVPDEAIGADQNRRLVMVVDESGKVTPREVRPGPRIDGYRVIRDGLDGSEVIVIEGLMRARPGATVTPDRVTLPLVAEN
jgi:RND family efflux transporter MFP subunit